ncbi:MAG: dihydrodipicolinate synthase family protein [Candidatus Pacebacteria bacterium]|nr:dihydrodipicolinate synthase family protein [Candidatus Paceibacterota bacterium]
MDATDIRHHLTGPVMSLRTPLDKNGDIDHNGVRNIIDAGIAGGSKTVMLTVGDSHYDILSDDEIVEMTRVTVDHTAQRAMVIAADRYHGTSRAVEFATFAKSTGADMVMCLPPDWAQSTTPRTLAEHYATVASVLPVMIVTNRFIPRGEEFGLETLQRALDASTNVVAIKDDMCGVFAQKMAAALNERCAIISGGQKRNHLSMYPYGGDGYLSTFVQCKTDVAKRYWHAIQKDDVRDAARIIAQQDGPFFDYVKKQTGNFDACIHGMLELNGLAQRHRRKPYYTIGDAELEQLADRLKTLGLLQ